MEYSDDVIKEFFDGYKEFINNRKIDIVYSFLDDIISQNINVGNKMIVIGGKSRNWMEIYTDLWNAKRMNELRSENLKKILEDGNGN